MFQEQFNQELLAGIPVILSLTNVSGEFLVGETISDGVSGRGLVTAFDATAGTLSIILIMGEFDTTNSIVGGTSGATSDVTLVTLGASAGKFVNGKKTVQFQVIGGAMASLDIQNGNYSFTEGMILDFDGGSSQAKIAAILFQEVGVSAVVILQDIVGTPAISDAYTVLSSPNPAETNLPMEGRLDMYEGTPDFQVSAFLSNDEFAPDITLPSSAGNSYSPVQYTDEATGSTYTNTAPYNPGGTYETVNFNVETNGAVWFFLVVKRKTTGTFISRLTAFSNYV